MKITQRLAENEQLSFTVKFDSDKYGTQKGYMVIVRKEFIQDDWIQIIPFADGNFTAFLKGGKRKSDKQIKIICDFIADNVDLLVHMWNEGDYNEMIDMIRGGIK